MADEQRAAQRTGCSIGVLGRPPCGVGGHHLSRAILGRYRADARAKTWAIDVRSDLGSPRDERSAPVDGAFGPAFEVLSGQRAVALAAADFNGDGILDLAVAVDGAPGNVHILTGTGTGTFTRTGIFNTGLIDLAGIAVADFTEGHLGAMSAQMSSAVLRFRSAGVSHVLFVTVNNSELWFFMPAAESQGYRPRYGLASYHVPATLPQFVPAAQLHGAVGIGWSPYQDVVESQDPGGRPAVPECMDLMERRASRPANRSEEGVAVVVCEKPVDMLLPARMCSESVTSAESAVRSAWEKLRRGISRP